VVNYSSSKEGGERVVAEIVGAGGKAIAVQGDMSKSADVRRLFEATKQAFGAVDILVNNAGVFQFDPLEAVTEDEFHREFNTNVLGPILATQEAVKHFGPQGGSVINIGSIAGSNPVEMSVVYSATKGALDTITRELSKELGPKNIRVNSINPGVTETEGVQRMGFIGTDQQKDLLARTPLGRLGRPDDIAPIAVFLASDRARWITGETLAAGGGLR